MLLDFNRVRLFDNFFIMIRDQLKLQVCFH